MASGYNKTQFASFLVLTMEDSTTVHRLLSSHVLSSISWFVYLVFVDNEQHKKIKQMKNTIGGRIFIEYQLKL